MGNNKSKGSQMGSELSTGGKGSSRYRKSSGTKQNKVSCKSAGETVLLSVIKSERLLHLAKG